MTWIRGGPTSLDSHNITEAIDGSLRRLGVDYIDLYQIHWPDRYVPMFGETEYDPSFQYTSVPMEEQLEALGRAIDAGKNQLAGLQPNGNGYTFRKYHSSDDSGPPEARMNLFKGRYSEGESRYKLQSPKVKLAVKEYTQIAAKYGISPATLAIAFVLRHPLVASAVFGATKLWQLYEVLQAARIHLPEEIPFEINDVHARYPNPCP